MIDAATEKWNRDHIPAKRVFGSEILDKYNLQLAWLRTHITCNSDYRADEEYFIASFVGHVGTDTANAVRKDLRDAAAKGHGVGLLRDVISRTGRPGSVVRGRHRSRLTQSIHKGAGETGARAGRHVVSAV